MGADARSGTAAVWGCGGMVRGGVGAARATVDEGLSRVNGVPVYALGGLPECAEDEAGATTGAGNAVRAVEQLASATEAVLAFDNALWANSGESATDPDVWERLNETLVEQLSMLFAAGEGDHDRQLAEPVVDTAEVIATIEAGGPATPR